MPCSWYERSGRFPSALCQTTVIGTCWRQQKNGSKQKLNKSVYTMQWIELTRLILWYAWHGNRMVSPTSMIWITGDVITTEMVGGIGRSVGVIFSLSWTKCKCQLIYRFLIDFLTNKNISTNMDVKALFFFFSVNDKIFYERIFFSISYIFQINLNTVNHGQFGNLMVCTFLSSDQKYKHTKRG